MRIDVLPPLAQPILIQLGQGHLRTHKNDQLLPLLASCCATERRADQRNAREIRNATGTASASVPGLIRPG